MGKVIIKFMKGSYTNDNAAGNVIKYVLRESARTDDIACGKHCFNLYGYSGCVHHSAEGAIRDFMKLKKIYRKEKGVQVKHMVISFPVKRVDISKDKLKKLLKKTISAFGMKYQMVYALHEDTDSLHIHMAINSVCLDGSKFSMDNKEQWNINESVEKIWGKYI